MGLRMVKREPSSYGISLGGSEGLAPALLSNKKLTPSTGKTTPVTVSALHRAEKWPVGDITTSPSGFSSLFLCYFPFPV